MKGYCVLCGNNGRLVVHHKDGNHSNDIPTNRINLCYRCHLVAHNRADKGNGRRSERLPLDWRPMHLSPVEIKRQYLCCFPRA